MRKPTAASVAVLAGAVALASAAYGIGTQTGDGNASAARDGDRDGERHEGERHVFLPFDDLADELGVNADELRAALEDFRERESGERRDRFATALAKPLGKPADEVRAALDEVGPGAAGPGEDMRHGCGPGVSLRALAAELDVTQVELRKALREAVAGKAGAWRDHHNALVAFLADRFGLSEDEVRQALPEPPSLQRHGPDGPRPFGPGGPPPFGP